MGSGKTTVGKALADQLSYQFLDTDDWIEKKENKTINEIFKQKGETYFRDLETDTIKRLYYLEKHIISTGGGLPLKEENGEILKQNGFIVYLDVTKDTVLKRLEGDKTRPLLAGNMLEQNIKERLEYRKPIYQYTAHISVSVDDRKIEDIVEEIKRNYELIVTKSEEK